LEANILFGEKNSLGDAEQEHDDDRSNLLSNSLNDKSSKGWYIAALCSGGYNIDLFAIIAWFIWISTIPIVIFSSLISSIAFSRLKPPSVVASISSGVPDTLANKRQLSIDELMGAAVGLPHFTRFFIFLLLAISVEVGWYSLGGGPLLEAKTMEGLNALRWSIDGAWHDIRLRFFYKPSDLGYWTNHDIYSLYLGEETLFDAVMPYPIAPPPSFENSTLVTPDVPVVPTTTLPLSKSFDWSYFEAIYIVTLSDYRTFDRERLQPTLVDLENIGIDRNSVSILRTTLDRESGARGCWNSHQSVARHATAAGYKTILVFEDDIEPAYGAITPESLEQITDFLKKEEWDVFFFGHMPMSCNAISDYPPLNPLTGTRLMKVNSFLTHAYALHAPNIASLSTTDYAGAAVDNAFFMQLNGKYAAYPMWFYQRPVKSTLDKSASVNYLTTQKFLSGLEDQVCAKKGSFLYYMISYFLGDSTVLHQMLSVDVYSRVIYNDDAWIFWVPCFVVILLLELLTAAIVWSTMDKDSVLFNRINRRHIMCFQALTVILWYVLIYNGDLLLALALRFVDLIFFLVFRVVTVSCIIPTKLPRGRGEINASENEGTEEVRHRRATEPNEEGNELAVANEGGKDLRRRPVNRAGGSVDLTNQYP
jgi:glycosyl transferase family 25